MKGETTKENIAKMVSEIYKENNIKINGNMWEMIEKNPFVVCCTLAEIIKDMKR